MSNGRRQGGFTYLAVICLVAAMAVGLAATAEIGSQTHQREKEAELLWVGNQFRHAIGLYYQRAPGGAKRYPEKLEDLVEDRRYLSTQRYLRRIYADPVSGAMDWGLVRAPDGGIMGVHSLSEKRPIRSAGFSSQEMGFAAATTYRDWLFVYDPSVPAQP